MSKPRIFFAALVIVSLSTLSVLAQGNSSRAYRGDPLHPLTGPSNASPVAIVAQFLRSQGYDGATIASIVSVTQQKGSSKGISQARMEQRISGLRVHDAEIKAALTDRGELVHLLESIVRVPSGPVGAARADERQALRAALQSLYPTLNVTLTPSGRDGNDTVIFGRTPFFHDDPRVTRVLIPTDGGGLTVGFL